MPNLPEDAARMTIWIQNHAPTMPWIFTVNRDADGMPCEVPEDVAERWLRVCHEWAEVQRELESRKVLKCTLHLKLDPTQLTL